MNQCINKAMLLLHGFGTLNILVQDCDYILTADPLWLLYISVAEQTGLRHTWSQSLKTGFLTLKPI